MNSSRANMKKNRLTGILLAMLLGWLPVTGHTAEEAVEEITNLLSQRFYEVEFFVFERSAVMDFNTREILLHKSAEAYPMPLLAMPYPGETIGEHYRIDPLTLLCMSYPTLVYTTTPQNSDDESIPDDTPGTEPTAETDDAATDSSSGSLEALLPPGIEPEIVVDPRALLIAAVADFEQELIASSNQWLPEDSFRLTRESRQVQRRAGGRMLFHGRWLQAIPPRDAPVPVLLPDTALTGPGKELSGSVDVTLGRYLHFRSTLNYSAPALGESPYQVALSPAGESLPAGHTTIEESGFMTLAQSRRMRSEELHYLDHPKLGIVVRIDPITVPEGLLALHAELTETLE